MTTTRPTRILILGAGQGETPIRRLGPGDCFGEIALLGDQIWPFKLSAFIVITSLDTSSLSRDSGRMPTRSSRSRLKKVPERRQRGEQGLAGVAVYGEDVGAGDAVRA